jgi:plastocyanin
MRLIRPILLSMTGLLIACGGGDGGVTPPPPSNALDHIAVTPTTLALNAGQAQTITATGQASDNSTVATTFTYTSSAEAVASVSATGRVLGISAGTATITVTGTAGSVTKTAPPVTVTVTGSLPTAVAVVAGAETNTFTPKDVAIQRGGTVTWTFPGITHNVEFQAATGAPANIGNTGNSNTGIERTFNTAGNFQYSCSLHSGMTGSVLVP